MERFCSKCGSLVTGEGKFCPKCGEPMDSAVDLSKPSSQPYSQPTDPAGMPYAQQSTPVTPNPAPYSQRNTYNTTGNYAQMPNYPMNNTAPAEKTETMTVGQWVGTILLTSCIPVVSLVLLFVFAFGDSPQPKKNYCRANLIIMAIVLGIELLLIIGTVACTGCIGASLAGSINDYSNYYY